MSTFLRKVLLLDAATCVATGLLLALLAPPLAPILGLPDLLLQYAGLVLLPVGAFMAWVATRDQASSGAVGVVIAGNAAWVAGSVLVLLLASPTALGYGFVVAQAVAVAVLAELEYIGLRRYRRVHERQAEPHDRVLAR